MKPRHLSVFRSLFLLLACLPLSCWAADTRSPVQIVNDTALEVATRVEADRARLAGDPQALYQLVDQVFLPVFDTRYAGQLVLGRNWRAATPEQRRQFVDTFYDFLVRSYAESILKFRKDNIQVFPAPAGQAADQQRTVVRTQMRLDDGSSLPVDYSMRVTPDGWRVFDVRIEGVSYVQNYRNQFDAEIAAKGLDAVIARLQAEGPKNPPAEAQQPQAGKGKP
jgi:phospholipid transport system substrate-binding protein